MVLAERFSAVVSVRYVRSLPIPPMSLNLEKVKRRTGCPDSGQVRTWKGTSLADKDETPTARKRSTAEILDMLLCPLISGCMRQILAQARWKGNRWLRQINC